MKFAIFLLSLCIFRLFATGDYVSLLSRFRRIVLYNIGKAVKATPVLVIVGLLIYALWPWLFPNAVYTGLVIGTIILKGNSTVISHLFYNNKKITNVKGLKIVFPDVCIDGDKITSIKHVFGAGCQDSSPEIKANLVNDIQLVNFDRHAIENIDTAFFTSGIDEYP